MSERRPKPLIVPIFIPYQGCPHRCVFCEQEKITSQKRQLFGKEYVEQILSKAIHADGFSTRQSPEIAFYGGTFTSLPLGRMQALLEAAKPFIEQGYFNSIRVSTRPDSLDETRLTVMKDYGVTTVELGAQSMDNNVLNLSKRGHTAEDTVKAVRLLQKSGFRVGIQLMPGLPGDSEDIFYSTITNVINLQPDMVRLYPAVVIRGTELATLYEKDLYEPLGIDDAVEICMESCIRLEERGIPVIRIGLMSSPSLLEEGQIMAGPWHPAFGFLVRSGIYQRSIESVLPGPGEAENIRILVSAREEPLIRGYKNLGLRGIKAKTGVNIIEIKGDDSIPEGRVKIELLQNENNSIS